jgi:hypothetical protein
MGLAPPQTLYTSPYPAYSNGRGIPRSLRISRTTRPAALRHGFRNDATLPAHKHLLVKLANLRGVLIRLPRGRSLLPSANCRGIKMVPSNANWITRNPLAGAVRHTRAVERADCGHRNPDDRRAGGRTCPACVQHSAFRGSSYRRHRGWLNPRSQKFGRCNVVGYCRRIHHDGLRSGDF